MPIDLSNLMVDKAVCTVSFGGSDAKLTYRPSKLTTDALAVLDEDGGIITFLTDLLIDWDVKNHGKKVPLNHKSLSPLPLPFLRATMLSILRDRGDGLGEAETNSPAG